MESRPASPPDTIAAIATAPGRGGIGVVRVSGAGLGAFALALCGRAPRPRTAHFTRFLDEHERPIDEGVLLYFAAPASFTGEDVIELQAPVKIRINDKYELFGMQATQAEIIAVLLVVAGAFGVYYAYHKHKKLLN